ncbi:hypothetical protein B0H15DRAFT_1025774 [Mycena belliarum]|uniref:Uncharacterized protein n=1 Tax=Mycena belliarum TaxID=1033014 RepID=A0AAD6XJC4_9AGAR|nr:hypothetical protein B0H15DRAFT_1025774 [Mycena belliae]
MRTLDLGADVECSSACPAPPPRPPFKALHGQAGPLHDVACVSPSLESVVNALRRLL